MKQERQTPFITEQIPGLLSPSNLACLTHCVQIKISSNSLSLPRVNNGTFVWTMPREENPAGQVQPHLVKSYS